MSLWSRTRRLFARVPIERSFRQARRDVDARFGEGDPDRSCADESRTDMRRTAAQNVASAYGALAASLRRIASVNVVFAYGVLGAFVLVALCVFMARPVPPFAYWRDIGFAHQTAAGAVYTLHSWTDVTDALGWTPWYNEPLFFLNSNVSEAFIALVTLISGDTWLSIKILQVFEVIVAGASAYAMYATYSRSRLWALIFGFSYAALPATALAIRGNLAIGWPAVLAPAAIAAGTILIRRFGSGALPFVGFICGAVGYGIALEYAVFSSLPLFALIVTGERRRISLAGWCLFVPLGLVCCAAMGAFYLLPTFSSPIFSDAASRTASLVSGQFLAYFSETWNGLLTLLPREAYVSPFPEYNVAAAMPYLYLSGAIIWLAACIFLFGSNRRSGWTNYSSMAIVAICVILTLGVTFPFGANLWDALYLIPNFDAIRTTDRFILVPALFVVFWYVCALEKFSADSVYGRRAAGWASFSIVVLFVCFDISQHCFEVEPSLGVRQPQLDAVRTVVEAEGGKTVSFAGVNGAVSFEDASEYGVPQPISPAALDLGWRFLSDGNGAIGVLGRIGVRTVISAPNWTGETSVPNTATIYRRLPSAPLIFKSPEDVLVSRLAAREDVSSVSAVCVHGGPGAFDLLDDADSLRTTAFLEREADCRQTGYVNFDPRDLWKQQAPIEAWAASELLPSGAKVRDGDYAFAPNRTLLRIPWYRNSVDGDRPVFDTAGAVEEYAPSTAVLPSTQAWPSDSSIAIRVCSHAGGIIYAEAESTLIGTIHIAPAQGFRWYEIHATRPKSAGTAVTLHFEPDPQSAASQWNGFVIDGVAITRPHSAIHVAPTRTAFVAVSLDRFAHSSEPAESNIILAPAGLAASNVVATNMHYDTYQTALVWLADAATSQLRFPWTGPSGSYVVRAQAVLTKAGDTLGIGVTQNGVCCSSTVANRPGFTGVESHFQLRKGSQIVVRLVSPDFNVESTDRILSVSVQPAGQLFLSGRTATGRGGTIDFSQPSDALTHLATVHQLRVEAPAAGGTRGSYLTATSPLIGHPKSVSLAVFKVGDGNAIASLKCDGAPLVEAPLVDSDTTLAVSGRGFNRCSTRIRWLSDNLRINFFRVIAGGESVPKGSAEIWLPAGTYRASLLNADGSLTKRFDLRSAGCAQIVDGCTFNVAARHRFVLGETPSAARLLLFTSVTSVRPPGDVEIVHTAALRWDVSVRKQADVTLTQIDDGNWLLMGGARTYVGERCDITNTCFPAVAPGRYRLVHRWPPALRLGLEITALTLAVPLLYLLILFIAGFIKRHRRPSGTVEIGAV